MKIYDFAKNTYVFYYTPSKVFARIIDKIQIECRNDKSAFGHEMYLKFERHNGYHGCGQMVNIVIRGRPEKVSKEELRSMFQAMICLQEFHNKKPQFVLDNTIYISVTKCKNRLGKCMDGSQAAGRCLKTGILVASWLSFEHMFTCASHETIHYFNPDFPDGHREWLTSTLNNRLNPSAVEIYNALIEGVYERAAYFAHTKISYKRKKKDEYNKDEWNIVECSDAGARYRKFERKGSA